MFTERADRVWQRALSAKRAGSSVRRIAKELGLHKQDVRKMLRRGAAPHAFTLGVVYRVTR